VRLAALSVDLDEIPNYFQIHGLGVPQGPAADLVYDVALERLGRFAADNELPLTLFAIGADMARTGNAERLRAMVEHGHEIGNHSLDHLYDLTRRSRDEMHRQVAAGVTVLSGATGVRPTGFRAPGYTLTDGLVRVLEEVGVTYDSSVFPCPPYYLAKAAKLGAIRLARRHSLSVLDRPSVLRAPRRPYRLGEPYFKRGQGLVELPVQVTRGLRLPFIGTTLTLAGATRARWLTRAVLGEPLVNLELHGIDVLDAADGLEALRGHQPDVRVPHGEKIAALAAVVETLKRGGYSFVRLDEAAERFS